MGAIALDDAVPLGAVITGRHPGRTSDTDITVCDLVGIGVQDAAIAAQVWAKATAGRAAQFTQRSPLVHRSGTRWTPWAVAIRQVPKVLIIEDDDVIAQGMSRHLASAGSIRCGWRRVNRASHGSATSGARRRRARPHASGSTAKASIEEPPERGIGTRSSSSAPAGTRRPRARLEIGADDYLVASSSRKELVARVRAAARRGVRAEEERRGDPVEAEELLVDPLNFQAFVDGRSAELTPTEFSSSMRWHSSAAGS